MEAARKRGLAYPCPKGSCDWVGEKGQCVTHYVRHHCSAREALYDCTLCSYAAGSRAQLTDHKKSQRHMNKLRGKDNEDEYLKEQPENKDVILNTFRPLTADKSRLH
jgi:hypothetical protein